MLNPIFFTVLCGQGVALIWMWM